MEHPAFSDAGGQAGMEIWTIDKFEPVSIESNYYGKFYNGDSYIVLKGDRHIYTSTLSYDAHFWLGSKTTQDKMGSAAILTITLDDMLGGKAVHHREVQGHESSQFLGYFKPAIRYLEGGNESGFTEVVTNAGAEKRLLKLSGCDNMRIEKVAADSSSLTRNHCFILEFEHDIFVLMPEGAKATQRRKIISVANKLRDDEHNGRATIEIIDEFSSDEDYAMFFEALGTGSKEEMQTEEEADTYARADVSTVYLYRVLVGDELDLIALSKPFKQGQLSSSEIYVLDTPCSGVYIWLGSGVEPEVKKTYNEIANQYLELKGYPNWVNVTRVSEGAESSTFKQYFHNWDTVATDGTVRALVSETDAGYFSGDADESAAAAKLIGKSASARGFMPDNGEGSLVVYRIADSTEDITDNFSSGVTSFFSGDVYVVRYQWTNDSGEDSYVIYYWAGSEATESDKQAASDLVSQLQEELEGRATVVYMPQGKETKHFLNIFKGNVAIYLGGSSSDYQPQNANGSYDDDGIRLFRVEGTELGVDMRVQQVPETANSLEDDDVYLLETKDGVVVWNGKESNAKEQEAAQEFVKLIAGDKEITTMEQGEETDAFWEALGGQIDEKEDPSGWRLAVNRRVTTPTTLTDVTVTVTGRVKFEDMDQEFSQQDLSDDGTYILDTGEELYLWHGKNSPERARAATQDIIKEYIIDDGLERTAASAIVIIIRQGAEPSVFTKLFPEWDNDMWDNLASYEDIKNETKAANSK
ncbi:hypothetical protein K1T71_000796 [Dendrolimus kikuchii]|uniref:Uncharacterized protein n=1 Tax=Dendrolimus kikuchii TaxID=765133 RepID=A0ACC1DK87_9NEOP|nr:hypothetical protein K1T71_000796 [Dendrolimus kikuchii]